MSAADIYARCLLPLKEGYPLYRPELHRRPNDDVYEIYRQEGISIGDVGIIRPGGDFDFLFNICRTRGSNSANTSNELAGSLTSAGLGTLNTLGISEQPISSITVGDLDGSNNSPSSSPVAREESNMSERAQQTVVLAAPHTTPTDFELIDPGEISITPEYVSTDHPYLAHGREEQATFNAEMSLSPIAVTPVGVGVSIGWTFECSSRQGAVMVAPSGATLTEVLEEERFLRSIESVGNWFKYAAEERHRRFKSLTLVTGVIKCQSWSVAAISNSSRANSGKVALSLMPAASSTLAASYSWRECIPTMCHSGPKPPSQTENQCVFVRGYRIMKQDPLLRFRKKVKATDLQEGSTEYYNLGKTAGLRRASESGWLQRKHSASPQLTPSEKTTVGDNITDSTVAANEHYVVERLSNATEPYHPSDIINRYLLEQVPDADFAMTHDKHWWALMRDNESSCPNEHELLTRLSNAYRAVLRYGVVCLQVDLGHDIVATTDAMSSTQALTPLPIISLREHNNGNGIRSIDESTPTLPDSPLSSKLNNFRSTDDPSSTSSDALLILPPPPVLPTHTSTPLSLPGPSTLHPWATTNSSSKDVSMTCSVASSLADEILSPGDVVGEGIQLQGEDVRLLSVHPTAQLEPPALELEVIKRLGTGSYAIIYLVREVLSRSSLEGIDSNSSDTSRASVEYGRDFAIKCLSKANLDAGALAAQMAEVTIHQSLRLHPNIATLHRTLETSSFLLLLLEFVPGKDLFYFLEPACDHDDDYDDDHDSTSEHVISPARNLFSHSSLILLPDRLGLVVSIFSQMCNAVAACHDQQVFHRDIKPENFIVMDDWHTLPNGSRECNVTVKLTDFGISTTDLESSDMDCGSAPYMSYECRNNLAPIYKPRGADIWSLGIVLINMLYRCNPWQDTAHETCNLFDLYRKQPVDFLLQRFTGMTLPVAEYLATKVLCVLDNPIDDSQRVEASEFGIWAQDLPSLLTSTSAAGQRVISTSSTDGLEVTSPLPPRRRKRGARKGRGTDVPTFKPFNLKEPINATLEVALQTLAREISSASKLLSSNSPSEFSDGQRAPAILMSPAPAKDKSVSQSSQPENSSTAGRQLESAADKGYIAYSNWRNSTSSSTTSSSSSTSYSSSSARSVSTQASSLSASSWRTGGTTQTKHKNTISSTVNTDAAQVLPKNVKFMTGVPWELSELPSSLHTESVGDTLGSPHRKQVYKKPNDQLDAIAERSDVPPITPLPASQSQGSTESHMDVEEMVLGDKTGCQRMCQRGR